MYKKPTIKPTGLVINQGTEGETIETKIERIVNNKEPIKDGAPIIYTERKEGIRPSTNIRTDRWEIAIDATEKVAKSYKARRDNKAGKVVDINQGKENGGAESIQGKDGTSTDK